MTRHDTQRKKNDNLQLKQTSRAAALTVRITVIGVLFVEDWKVNNHFRMFERREPGEADTNVWHHTHTRSRIGENDD